jgi:protein ImuA
MAVELSVGRKRLGLIQSDNSHLDGKNIKGSYRTNQEFMIDSHTPLTQLKRRLERLERPRINDAGLFTLGLDALDERLGGGLARGALHELCADDAEDRTSASGFALMLALQAARGKPILWVCEDKGERLHGQLYAPGMIELGANPDFIIMVSAPDTLAALRAAADIVGCMALGAVIIEPYGAAKSLDLTASRKLVLTAEKSGVPAFIVRDKASGFASAASTRWAVTSARSVPLSGDAPGHPLLWVELVRHRGGIAPFAMTLEWNRDEQTFRQAFREPALSGALFPAAERGQMAA